MLKRACLTVLATGGMLLAGVPSAALAMSPAHRSALITTSTAAGWTSGNWSGYAGTTTGATSVQGNWTVPTVTKTTGNTYSSSWIGIDGFTNSDLIQTGTEQDWSGGHAVYRAWWEILPAAETVIPTLTISPGNKMSANIHHLSGSMWSIQIKDVTTGKSFTIKKSYSGPADSVEWIQEAPEVGGAIATLAHYSTFNFLNCAFDGFNAALTTANRGVMIQGGKHVSTPSNPSTAGNGFAVAYGAKTPPPPS